MSKTVPMATVAELRECIARLEGGQARVQTVLPFGVEAIDKVLPGGGLRLGALHEVAGGANGAVDGAAAAIFAASITARLKGKVLWCITRPDLFAPALAQAGLSPGRVIHVEAGDETSVLACFEEGLRHGGPAAVVAELALLPLSHGRGDEFQRGAQERHSCERSPPKITDVIDPYSHLDQIKPKTRDFR